MSKELSPKYNPAEVEAGRYQKWLDEDVFKPSGDKKAKPYSIVIPPPNVTGKLHLGHAWDTTCKISLSAKNVCKVSTHFGFQVWTTQVLLLKPRLKRVWLKTASLVMTWVVKNSLKSLGMERRVCHYYQGTMGQDGALGRLLS